MNTAAPDTGTAARRRRRRGSEVVEFSLVMLPMLAYLFIIIDLGWAVFARSTLQYALREGCRYAITQQIQGTDGHTGSIKTVVQQNSMGLLSGAAGRALIQVRYYVPTDLSTPLTNCAAGNTSPGNVVEVAVQGFSLAPLLPVLRNSAPLQFTAAASDMLGGAPVSGPAPVCP